MKRMIALIAIAACGVFISADTGLCRNEGNLYNMFRKEPLVNVFLTDVVNASESTDIDTKDLKQKIKDALEKRKSIKFEVVGNKEEADIAIAYALYKLSALDKVASRNDEMLPVLAVLQNYLRN